MAMKKDSFDREAALARLAAAHRAAKDINAEDLFAALAKDELEATGRVKRYRIDEV